MKRMVIAAALLACGCTPPAADEAAAPQASAGPTLDPVSLPLADGAGNRMEALTQSGERWCTGDGAWCVSKREADVAITRGDQGAGAITIGEAEENNSWEVWPQIIRIGRNDESVLVGVTRSTRQMYSGGGGEASQLVLYAVAGGAVNEVVQMPLSASATVRACFDEDDQRQRAGACHDEYAFVTRISLDETVASGPPRIVLETAAASYPGLLTRNADSLENEPLQPSDLVWATSELCSYRRVFARSADGLYAPERPLPDCSDYLEP